MQQLLTPVNCMYQNLIGNTIKKLTLVRHRLIKLSILRYEFLFRYFSVSVDISNFFLEYLSPFLSVGLFYVVLPFIKLISLFSTKFYYKFVSLPSPIFQSKKFEKSLVSLFIYIYCSGLFYLKW